MMATYLSATRCEPIGGQSRPRKRQRCDRCGGRFGLVTYRWWGAKLCKRACVDAYRREMAFHRYGVRFWFGWGWHARAAVDNGTASLPMR